MNEIAYNIDLEYNGYDSDGSVGVGRNDNEGGQAVKKEGGEIGIDEVANEGNILADEGAENVLLLKVILKTFNFAILLKVFNCFVIKTLF